MHAEEIGINFIWQAADALERGEVFSGAHTNSGLTIEQLVERTWRTKEIAPDVAAPRVGGPLAFWTERLRGCESLLNALAERVAPLELERIIYPPVLSGPLDAGQRIDFLGFHLERHLLQAQRTLTAYRKG